MAFEFNDPIFIKILEVGDVLEVTNDEGTYAIMATENDLTPGGKKSLKSMYKNSIVPGKIQVRIGRFVEIEDFVLMNDEEHVYTPFSKKHGDVSTNPMLEAVNVFARGTVSIARSMPDRKYYKFI